jgi:hypothetical protein
MDKSTFCASASRDAFLVAILGKPNPASVAAIVDQRNPASVAEFVASILDKPNPASAAEFAVQILGEHNFNPDEPRDWRGRWTKGDSLDDSVKASAYGVPERSRDTAAASNTQTGVYQIGGGHHGRLNIMSDSLLDRGAVDPASAKAVVAAARTAADRIDRAIDLLENNYPQVQAIIGAVERKHQTDASILAYRENRDRMLNQLRTVRDALNDPSKYTNIVLDFANSGDVQNRAAYVEFLARDRWPQFSTNIVRSFIHVTPFFFSPTVTPSDRAIALQHEFGRYYNSLGETNTGTWYDADVWDRRINYLVDEIYDVAKAAAKQQSR